MDVDFIVYDVWFVHCILCVCSTYCMYTHYSNPQPQCIRMPTPPHRNQCPILANHCVTCSSRIKLLIIMMISISLLSILTDRTSFRSISLHQSYQDCGSFYLVHHNLWSTVSSWRIWRNVGRFWGELSEEFEVILWTFLGMRILT